MPPQRNVRVQTVKESQEQLMPRPRNTSRRDAKRPWTNRTEASVTRATVYRYLPTEEIFDPGCREIRRSRMLLDRARAYLDYPPTFADEFVKGIVHSSIRPPGSHGQAAR